MTRAILIRPDPPVRDDGRCARPGCNKMRHPEKSRRYGGVEAEKDPFCSTDCCRAWHRAERTAAIEEEAIA